MASLLVVESPLQSANGAFTSFNSEYEEFYPQINAD
jgi:hypothetical protein